MRLLLCVFCLFTAGLCADQEQEFTQLLSAKNIYDLSTIDFSVPESIDDQIVDSQIEGLTAKDLVFQTYNVYINTSSGYKFHIADYYDGSRVVTCLNGPLVGKQAVGAGGVILIESTTVQWYSDGFTHWYPTGVIYTFIEKQVMKVY